MISHFESSLTLVLAALFAGAVIGVLIVSKATEPNTTNMQNLLFIS